MESFQHIETDLFIIGSGMAGMSAALFAANRKINSVVAGGAGGFEYSSGLLDLWGLSLTQKGLTQRERVSKKPWDMVLKIYDQMPDHPYAKIKKEPLKQAFYELIKSLKSQGLTYTGYDALNSMVMTPFGTLRPTYRLPVTMRSNIEAFKKKGPCLILDFRGLREFSAVFFKEMMKKNWPGIRTQCLEFPGTQLRSEVFTPFLARSLETEQIQEKFLKLVKPLLKGESYLGLPAILGVQSSGKILNMLEKELNIKVFEIPTSPISVPGIRLKETLMKAIEGSSVTLLQNQRVIKVLKASNKGFECQLGSKIFPAIVHAKAVLLATGRFLGKGLYADQKKIYESIFDLPVCQPKTRKEWHRPDFFNPDGHKINQAGIETDDFFRPVTKKKKPVFNHLFASGSILAHQDWMRSKCGAGLSIGTSFHAIQSYLQIQNGKFI
ncbi:MAG: glycerol-3-phosphate dehydrogenase subunit GlpB [Desulfobacula sp.]|uniref:glycerol-3-phosphate dehydrogenase subunit GlpB n=1 Tax=Desulfobacula sp. TaxID=2593537 RepID=UPI0025B9911A|nr:glycerol-3-phosphate dehydrogenase subunit GlpB [Desulfobacula sp.]MCD4721200.1 glycerol-3-phosphate dehydrogenase subunit GlpB [Desulfobacula sp.]